MKNWLGQDIEIGDHVYKGARSGNTSDYRVGEVLDLREQRPDRNQVDYEGAPLKHRDAKIKWLYRHGGTWKRYPWEDKVSQFQVGAVRAYQQNPGWNDLDSLVKVDISDIRVVPGGQILQ